MKFTPEVGQQIIAALGAKLPNRQLGNCTICGVTAWELVDAFVTISLSGEPNAVQLGGQILPNAVLVCTNCGNTHLLNLNRLGLGHLLKPDTAILSRTPPETVLGPPLRRDALDASGIKAPPKYTPPLKRDKE
jgi:hypothetical protein